MPPRAKTQPPLGVQDDPRHPDTQADTVRPVEPGDFPDLDPDTYGFREIDTEEAKAALAGDGGPVEPVKVETAPIDTPGPQNSTFASRLEATRKVVTSDGEDVTTK